VGVGRDQRQEALDIQHRYRHIECTISFAVNGPSIRCGQRGLSYVASALAREILTDEEKTRLPPWARCSLSLRCRRLRAARHDREPAYARRIAGGAGERDLRWPARRCPVRAQTLSPAVRAQVDAGQQLFATTCANCHGSAGKGAIGPALAKRDLSQELIRNTF